jgi:hypothetical protein
MEIKSAEVCKRSARAGHAFTDFSTKMLASSMGKNLASKTKKRSQMPTFLPLHTEGRWGRCIGIRPTLLHVAIPPSPSFSLHVPNPISDPHTDTHDHNIPWRFSSVGLKEQIELSEKHNGVAETNQNGVLGTIYKTAQSFQEGVCTIVSTRDLKLRDSCSENRLLYCCVS